MCRNEILNTSWSSKQLFYLDSILDTNRQMPDFEQQLLQFSVYSICGVTNISTLDNLFHSYLEQKNNGNLKSINNNIWIVACELNSYQPMYLETKINDNLNNIIKTKEAINKSVGNVGTTCTC